MADSIDTFFIDLAVRGDSLQTDVGKFVKDLERQLDQDLGKTTENVERRFQSMGGVISRSLQGMITTLAQTKNPLAAATSGLMSMNAGVQAAAEGGAGWAQAISGVLGPLSMLVTVLALASSGLQKVIGFLEQTAQQGVHLAATVQTLNTGLEVIAKNSGNSVDLVREKVSTLQGTGITTQESIRSLMQFMSQDLPIDNIEKLARAGQDMAVAFGQNSTETFNRFIYAITTGNAQVLQMVGIQRTENQMMEDYALTLNKTVAQLTQLERRQAVVNGIIKEAANYSGLYEKSMESLGKRIGSLPRYIEEGTLAFGQTLIPVLDLSVTATEKFWKAFQKLFVVMETKDIGGVMKEVPIQLRDGTQQLTEFGEQIRKGAEYVETLLKPPLMWIIAHLPDMAKGVEQFATVFMAAVRPSIELSIDLIKTFEAAVTSAIQGFLKLYNDLTNSNVEFEDGWTSLKQIFEAVVIALIIGISAVDSGVKGINQLLNKEAPTAWQTWRDVAIAAAKDVYDAMEGVKTQVKEVLSLEQQYEKETGKKATSTTYTVPKSNPYSLDPYSQPVPVMPGLYGPPKGTSVTQQTPEYKQWLNERLAIGNQGNLPPDTVMKKEDPDAARRAAAVQKVGMSFADAVEAGNKAVEDAMKRFYGTDGKGGTLKQFDTSVTKALQSLSDSLTKGLENLNKQYNKAKEKLGIDFSKQLVELDKQGNEARLDEERNYQERQIRSAEDYQLRMKRMEEDYRRSLADAVQNRDAKGALKIMRDFAVNRKNAEEDFNNQRRREDEDHRKRQEEITRRQDAIRRQMQEAYEQRLKDLADSLEEQKKEMQDSYNEQRNELIKRTDEQRKDLINAHAQQMKDLKDGNEERLRKMVQNWVDVGAVDKKGAADILKGLDEYYGAKGKIEKLITDFVARNQRNQAIKITLEQGGNANPPPAVTPICPAGMRWSDARRQCVIDNDPVPQAAGGLITASRPTNVLMGEAGRETALFLPENARMGLSQAMSLLGSGSSGGGTGVLDINLRVTADGTISPEFENAILDRLADVVLEALPSARLEKTG